MFRLIDICISRVAVRIWSGNELRLRKGDIDLVLCKLRQAETSLNVPRRPPRNTKFSLSLSPLKKAINFHRVKNRNEKKKFSRYTDFRGSKTKKRREKFFPTGETISKGMILLGRKIKFLVLPPDFSQVSTKRPKEKRRRETNKHSHRTGNKRIRKNSSPRTRKESSVEGRPRGKGAKSKREKGAAVVANQRPPSLWTRTTVEVNVIRNNFISSLCISSRPNSRTCLILFSRNRIFVVAPTRGQEKVICRKLGKIERDGEGR